MPIPNCELLSQFILKKSRISETFLRKTNTQAKTQSELHGKKWLDGAFGLFVETNFLILLDGVIWKNKSTLYTGALWLTHCQK